MSSLDARYRYVFRRTPMIPDKRNSVVLEEAFDFRVERRDGYVFVYQRGRADNEGVIRRMQREIEDALTAGQCCAVVFDNRDTQTPDEWVRAMVWSWLGRHRVIRRAALVQASTDSQKRSNDRATRAWRGISMSWINSVQIMAFVSEDDAARWAVSPLVEITAE